jgi:hypothetical protein
MPNFNTPRQPPRRLLLKEACPWEISSFANFAVDPDLVHKGVSVSEQKLLFIIRACKNMSKDGLDNTEMDKMHPAFIQDNVVREEAKCITQKLLADVASTHLLRLEINSPVPSHR